MVVFGAERGVALGALALAGLVARLEALEAEDVEALGQQSVFPIHFARRTRQLLLQSTTITNRLS